MKRINLNRKLKDTKNFFIGNTASYNLSKADNEKLIIDIYESIKEKLNDEPEIVAVRIVNKEMITQFIKNNIVSDSNILDKVSKMEKDNQIILLEYYGKALERLLNENDTSLIVTAKRLIERLIENIILISSISNKDINYLKKLLDEFKNNLDNKNFNLISRNIFSNEIEEIINSLKSDSKAKEIKFK